MYSLVLIKQPNELENIGMVQTAHHLYLYKLRGMLVKHVMLSSGLFCAHDHLPPLKKSSASLRRSVSTLSSPWPPQSPDALPLERDKFITVLLIKISITTKSELQSGNKMMETARHLDSLSKAALAQHFSVDEVWRSKDAVRPVSWIYSKRLWANHFFFLR